MHAWPSLVLLLLGATLTKPGLQLHVRPVWIVYIHAVHLRIVVTEGEVAA